MIPYPYGKPAIQPKQYVIKRKDRYILELSDGTPTFDLGSNLERVAEYLYSFKFSIGHGDFFEGLEELCDIEYNLSNRDLKILKNLKMVEKL